MNREYHDDDVEEDQGEDHECSSCGATVDTEDTICPYCGEESDESEEVKEERLEDNRYKKSVCPNCGEEEFKQYTCEFCGKTTCQYCEVRMKPCHGCGRMTCGDCAEEHFTVGGKGRDPICGSCVKVMDPVYFDSYWATPRRR